MDNAITTGTPSLAARPKTDRFLMGILAAVIVLLALAGISIALLRQSVRQLPANTPGGVVQGFYAALEQGDYDKAYGFLSDRMDKRPSRDEFTRYNMEQRSYRYETPGEQERGRITDERIYGNNASVTSEITHYYYSEAPFGGSGEWAYTEVFSLRRDNGTWSIVNLPYTYRPYKP